MESVNYRLVRVDGAGLAWRARCGRVQWIAYEARLRSVRIRLVCDATRTDNTGLRLRQAVLSANKVAAVVVRAAIAWAIASDGAVCGTGSVSTNSERRLPRHRKVSAPFRCAADGACD